MDRLQMDRLQIINKFIREREYKSFVGIGVFTGYTLDGVNCEEKIGIDPSPEHYKGKESIFSGTSDEFFKQLSKDKKFDCFFIDGMHLEEFVLRDIYNSLEHLNEDGVILLHDCNPGKFEHAQREWLEPEWNGTVYKAVIGFQKDDPFGKYIYYTINTDYGIGVIEKANIEIERCQIKDYNRGINDWEFFDKNRKELLNLISVEEFLKRFEKTNIKKGLLDIEAGNYDAYYPNYPFNLEK